MGYDLRVWQHPDDQMDPASFEQVAVPTPACGPRPWKIGVMAALLGLMVTPSAYADDEQSCDLKTISAVARWAGIKGKLVSWGEEPDGLIAAAACKAMPNSPGTTIAAVAFDTKHEGPASEQGGEKTQIVALVKNGKVVAANRYLIQEDATIAVGSYRIDTAPYVLSPKVRAFGVVFSSSARGPSCWEASNSDELTLWIREGDQLRGIFSTNLEETVADKPSCEGVASVDFAHMTIAVEKTRSHGFADLSITAHVNEGERTVRTVLKYNGSSYENNMLRPFFWHPE